MFTGRCLAMAGLPGSALPAISKYVAIWCPILSVCNPTTAVYTTRTALGVTAKPGLTEGLDRRELPPNFCIAHITQTDFSKTEFPASHFTET
jgi:hypothetical protein